LRPKRTFAHNIEHQTYCTWLYSTNTDHQLASTHKHGHNRARQRTSLKRPTLPTSQLQRRRWALSPPTRRSPNPPHPPKPRNNKLPIARAPPTNGFRLPLYLLRPLGFPTLISRRILRSARHSHEPPRRRQRRLKHHSQQSTTSDREPAGLPVQWTFTKGVLARTGGDQESACVAEDREGLGRAVAG